MTAIRATAVALALWLGFMSEGLTQTSPAPPQPLPQEQFDALVEAVRKAVVEGLKTQGTPAKAEPAKSASASPPGADQPGFVGTFGQQMLKVLRHAVVDRFAR